MSNLDQVKKKLAAKAAAMSRVLSSPDGQELVKALEEEFLQKPLFDPDSARQTDYNLGGRDVVIYMKQLQSYAENGNVDTK